MNIRNAVLRVWFVLLVSVWGVAASAAELDIELAEPHWQFLLSNQPTGKTEAQLQPAERSFAQRIQPLLAKQDYAAVSRAFDGRPIDGDSAALCQLRGQVLMSLKHYDEAERALLAALRKMPALALAHRSLSLLYMVKKEYPKAGEQLRRSIELGVADAQVYGQLAYVNLQSGNAASAVAGYRQALFLQPDNRQWQQGLLYALLNADALDQAQALVGEMLKRDAGDVSLWLLRSQVALKRERYNEALSSLEVALQLGDNRSQNIATAAQLHLLHGSVRRAVDLLVDNSGRRGRRDLLPVMEQVAAYLASRQQWQSLSRLLGAVERQKKIPAPMRAHFEVYRAQLAMQHGKLKRARRALQSAIDSDPTQGDALLALGDLYRRQQQPEQALLLYTRAEALPPFRERALLSRAQLEIDREAYPEALRLLRKAAQLDPNRSDIAANIRSLENLVRNRG